MKNDITHNILNLQGGQRLYANELYWYVINKMRNAYFNSLVTPGLGAAGHIRRFNRRLINEDFPTFGYPTIPARTYR